MKTLGILGFFAIIGNCIALCRLPSDFWCDHPKVALECTGSLAYCDRYRSTRNGKPTDIRLAFEAACPDSQRFVIDRLYPRVLNISYYSDFVNFKAIPWGLAKRETAEKVRCHHGERECLGNRLLTCTMDYFTRQKATKSSVFNCFMNLMSNKRQEPEPAIRACLLQSKISLSIMENIIQCAKGSQATLLQKFDEFETQRILNSPRFVPYIEINGHAHLHMQAYQMILAEKLRVWNSTLQQITPGTNTPSSRCNFPPDFWCSSSSITNECFNSAGCSNHLNTIYGRPIQLKVIYRSDIPTSRSYILGYVKRNFLLNSASNRERTIGKAVIELEPSASLSSPCGANGQCDDQALQHCIMGKVNDIAARTNMLVCLLEAGNRMRDAWISRCHTFKPEYKNIILSCADSAQWQKELAIRAVAQSSLQPVPRHGDTWIIINGYSLHSTQTYSNVLHRLICLWYRGPNHNRDDCDRCDYEATHC